MSLYQDIVSGKEKVSLVGLGYVGMPIAVAFARKIKVVGFDLNAAKIDLYKSGVDPTNEVGDEVIIMGSDGVNTILAEDIAKATGTINYEIICAIGQRLPKVYVADEVK